MSLFEMHSRQLNAAHDERYQIGKEQLEADLAREQDTYLRATIALKARFAEAVEKENLNHNPRIAAIERQQEAIKQLEEWANELTTMGVTCEPEVKVQAAPWAGVYLILNVSNVDEETAAILDKFFIEKNAEMKECLTYKKMVQKIILLDKTQFVLRFLI